MAIIYSQTIVLLITLLFLSGLTNAYPTSHDNFYVDSVSIYARDDQHAHPNASFETFDALFGYADSLKLWRFYPNASSGCCRG